MKIITVNLLELPSIAGEDVIRPSRCYDADEKLYVVDGVQVQVCPGAEIAGPISLATGEGAKPYLYIGGGAKIGTGVTLLGDVADNAIVPDGATVEGVFLSIQERIAEIEVRGVARDLTPDEVAEIEALRAQIE